MPRRCLHGVHPSASAATFPARITLPRRCLHGVHRTRLTSARPATAPLPRRCLHGVHPLFRRKQSCAAFPLPRRCLHGVHLSALLSCTSAWIFASALPARSASPPGYALVVARGLCLGAACTECIELSRFKGCIHQPLCLGAACTECIDALVGAARNLQHFASALPARSASGTTHMNTARRASLPRRCLHGVHRSPIRATPRSSRTLPRRCLHGVHPYRPTAGTGGTNLCLGAACTECIGKSRQTVAHHFVAYAVSR